MRGLCVVCGVRRFVSLGRLAPGLVALALGAGCGNEERESGGEDSNGLPTGLTLDTAGSDDGSEDDDGMASAGHEDKLDVGNGTGSLDCEEGQVCDECVVMEHDPCDAGTTDLFKAMGLNCPGDPQVTTSVMGSNQAMGVRTGFGMTNTWAPREGSAFGVLGSGLVVDLDFETPPNDFNLSPTHCNDDLGPEYDMGSTLPAPLRTNDVGGDCSVDPSLLGTGDCSNTIHGQFSQGGSANDYTEVRIQGTVPPTNNSFSYDFAFFSVEYPDYYNSSFNDMFVAWLESESWTGNISFDEAGNPISLNAGFLDYRDTATGSIPEFVGTCMRQHAGTKWLSTTAPVNPGETFTLVLAIFDLSDSILDSYVFIDNFQWGCDGTEKPSTKPVG